MGKKDCGDPVAHTLRRGKFRARATLQRPATALIRPDVRAVARRLFPAAFCSACDGCEVPAKSMSSARWHVGCTIESADETRTMKQRAMRLRSFAAPHGVLFNLTQAGHPHAFSHSRAFHASAGEGGYRWKCQR